MTDWEEIGIMVDNHKKEQAKKWFMKGWLCGKAIILQDLDYYFEQIWEEGIDREI